MIRKIFHYGEDVLREVAEPVTKIDDQLKQVISDMFETMIQAKGLGLAAPQVGIKQRFFIIDYDEKKWIFINPKILKAIGKENAEEGCLSLLGLRETVQRASKVICRATDLDGGDFEVEATGLMARAIQHELDHLDGVLFVDRISKARRFQLKRDLERIAAGETLETEDDDEEIGETAHSVI